MNRVNALLSLSGVCPEIYPKSVSSQTPSLLIVPGTQLCSFKTAVQNMNWKSAKSDLSFSAVWKYYETLLYDGLKYFK